MLGECEFIWGYLQLHVTPTRTASLFLFEYIL